MKNNKYVILALVGILIVLLISLSFLGNKTKLSGKDFIEKYNSTSNAVLVDVRTPAEFLSGHIDKAINIDIENSSFESEIKNLDKSKTYFVYCRSGNRSGQAVQIMRSNGINSIYELSGGIISNTNTIKLVTANNLESNYVVDPSDMVNGQQLISTIAYFNN
jgi:rhodanese-related sulfurtransferase